MPGIRTTETTQEEHGRLYVDVDIRDAEQSDIRGMLSIFRYTFENSNPRLWQLMQRDNPSDPLHYVVEDILRSHLNSPDCRFMVAYDVSDDESDDSNHEDHEYREVAMNGRQDSETGSDDSEDLRNLTIGLISLSVASVATARDVYATSDLRTYACLEVLERAQAMGEAHMGMNDPRFRLLYELEDRSISGQVRCRLAYPYLVVNALLLFPDCHNDVRWNMATKLLEWAVNIAEGQGLPIWTQIPIEEEEPFLQAGFTEKERFTLNLNIYRPHGSIVNWGAQRWVQMVYYCRHSERRRDF